MLAFFYITSNSQKDLGLVGCCASVCSSTRRRRKRRRRKRRRRLRRKIRRSSSAFALLLHYTLSAILVYRRGESGVVSMGVEENGSAAALGTNGNHALEHEVVLGGSEGLPTSTHKEGATTEQITHLNGGGGGGGEVTKSSWFKASLLWKGSSTFDSFLLAQAAQVSLWVCVLVFCVLSLCVCVCVSLSLSLSLSHTHTPQLFYFTLLPLELEWCVFLLKPILCILFTICIA
jgi:hypothetical protein